MEEKEFVDKVNRGIIELKIPRERPADIPTELNKIGTGYLSAFMFVALTALGCAVAELILAIKGIQ